MITEKKLLYFVEVCKTQNISTAAKNLFIAQPALSKTIQDLETDLGYPLFERQGRHITLNENGHLFYQYAVRIISTYDNARRALDIYNDKENKHITLGVSVCSQLLSDILDGFYQKHPDANISVRTGYPLDCMKDHLDLLLDAYPQLTTSPALTSQTASLPETQLMNEEICIAFSDNHSFASMPSISRSVLYHYPCILPSTDSCMGNLLDDLWARFKLRPLQSSSDINNSYVQCELASHGRYFTIVPKKSWHPAYTANHLSLAPLPDVELYRHVVLQRQPYLSPLAEEFVSYLVDYFANL